MKGEAGMSLSEKTKKWLKKTGCASLRGKTVIVTGAGSGIGYKTAEVAVFLGASVIMACRNLKKAGGAADELRREYPGSNVKVMSLDLADLSSVDAFADRIVSENIDVDIFVNNAGVFRQPGRKTKDGFELVIGTNYIGVFRLTGKLVGYLSSLPHPVYYMNTVSVVFRTARKIDFRDFYFEKRYSDLAAYSRSKLCLAIFSRALARSLSDTNLAVYMIHPGVSMTPLAADAYGRVVSFLANRFRGLFNSPEKSSLAPFFILAKQPPAGSLAGPSGFFGVWGYPKTNSIPKRIDRGGEELIAFTENELSGINTVE